MNAKDIEEFNQAMQYGTDEAIRLANALKASGNTCPSLITQESIDRLEWEMKHVYKPDKQGVSNE